MTTPEVPAAWRRRALGIAALCALLAGLWWVLIVRYYYHGNWTGLYCIGSQVKMPPEIEAEGLFRVPAPVGFDGQWYHAMAHDPLMQKNWEQYMDHPGMRYPRILIPGLAYIFAFGQQQWIDLAFRLVMLGFVFLGVYWLAEFAVLHGRAAWWGASFLLFPATLASLDRMLTDGPLLALAIGFALWAARPGWQLWVILAAAALTRDTGIVFALGASAYYVSRKDIKSALVCASATVPFLLWHAYSASRIASPGYPWHIPYPLAGIVTAVATYVPYGYGPGLRFAFNMMDEACLAATLATIVLAFLWAAKQWSPVSAAAAMLGVVALVVGSSIPNGPWEEVYGYGRVFTPIFLWLCLKGLQERSIVAWALTAIVSLRLLVFFVAPALSVIKGLAGVA